MLRDWKRPKDKEYISVRLWLALAAASWDYDLGAKMENMMNLDICLQPNTAKRWSGWETLSIATPLLWFAVISSLPQVYFRTFVLGVRSGLLIHELLPEKWAGYKVFVPWKRLIPFRKDVVSVMFSVVCINCWNGWKTESTCKLLVSDFVMLGRSEWTIDICHCVYSLCAGCSVVRHLSICRLIARPTSFMCSSAGRHCSRQAVSKTLGFISVRCVLLVVYTVSVQLCLFILFHRTQVSNKHQHEGYTDTHIEIAP